MSYQTIGNIEPTLNTVQSNNIVPVTDNTYNLGSSTNRYAIVFSNGFVATNLGTASSPIDYLYVNNIVSGSTGATGDIFNKITLTNPTNQLQIGTNVTLNNAGAVGAQVISFPDVSGTTGSCGFVLNRGASTIAEVRTFSSSPIISSLTASQAVVTDGSKSLTSLGYASGSTGSTLVSRDSSGNSSFNVASLLSTTNQLVTGSSTNLTTSNFPASSGAVTITYPNVTSTLRTESSAVIRVAKNGSDTTGSRGGSAFLTIAAAIAVATSGDCILVSPGTYTEGALTIPASVHMIGDSRSGCIITSTNSAIRQVTLGLNSGIHNFTINMTLTAQVSPVIGIFSSTTNFVIQCVSINITTSYNGDINYVVGLENDGGASTIIDIDDCEILMTSTNASATTSGNFCCVLGYSGSTTNISNSTLSCTRVGGTLACYGLYAYPSAGHTFNCYGSNVFGSTLDLFNNNAGNVVNCYGTLLRSTGSVAFTATSNQHVFGTPGSTDKYTTVSYPQPAGNITLTMPLTTDTIVGRATTDTLTNKIISSSDTSGTSFNASATSSGTGFQANAVTSGVCFNGNCTSGKVLNAVSTTGTCIQAISSDTGSSGRSLTCQAVGVGYTGLLSVFNTNPAATAIYVASGGVNLGRAVITQQTNINTAVTIDSASGVITTVSSTLGANLSTSFTVNNACVVIGSVVTASINTYSGTLATNGLPGVIISGITTGSFVCNLTNYHATNALNGTVGIGFCTL